MHIMTATILMNVEHLRQMILFYQIESQIRASPGPILKVEVKVIYSSTSDISEMVKDHYIIIAIKWEVICGLSIGIFIFDFGQLSWQR